jgi:hypothetical protein
MKLNTRPRIGCEREIASTQAPPLSQKSTDEVYAACGSGYPSPVSPGTFLSSTEKTCEPGMTMSKLFE